MEVVKLITAMAPIKIFINEQRSGGKVEKWRNERSFAYNAIDAGNVLLLVILDFYWNRLTYKREGERELSP